MQNVKCVSGGGIDDSCFNYNSQNLANKGNVAVAQDGGNGRGSGNGDGDGDDGSGGGGGGNSADPAINQAQSNVQNVQCVSGGGIDDSCFNYNSQNLANKGNVAVAQDGGNGRGSGNGDGDGDDGSGGGGGGNSADPAINQAQSNVQNVQCVSGGGIDDSCFNYNSQNLANKGNVAVAQDGGNGRGSGNGDGDGDGDDGSGGGGGNSADPAINQAQSNVQNVQCVSGGGIDDSCFNYNSQNLANKGNVAVAQDGGNGRGSGNGDGDGDGDDGSGGGGGNSADPAINQAQSNVQNVQCVSGKDAIVSCNNVSFQNQINEGNIALGQIY